jgi:hypothetical protein
MPSLGTLFVDLQAETGGFVSALSKAAASAQSAARQISRRFSDLQGIASQTFGAFGDFNPAISKISFALSSAGSAASAMMKEMGGIGGAMGPLAALSAGAATGLAALGASAIGIASHAAESAAKMYELSQSTGVNIETLSGFSFAAKTVGLDTQTLALGLEKMSKSAFAAATAPAGAANAYTRLGVSVRDAGDNIRPTDAILLDLADKFASMPDGIQKSALAIQIFGKGGDAMIPFLNKGAAGLKDFMDYAKAVGAVLTGASGAAAEEYSINLAKIGIAASGLENTLMVQLLPSLQQIAEAMKDWLSDPKNIESLKSIADFAGFCARSLMNLADALVFVGRASSALWQLTAGLDAFSDKKIVAFGVSINEAYGEMQKFAQTSSKIGPGVQQHPDLNWFGSLGANQTPPRDTGPQASGRADVVAELMTKLQAQAAAEIALGAATEKSAAASVLAKAAAEAETKIGEERARLLEQEKSLREQLADAQRESASGQTAGGERAVKLNAEIAGLQKMLAELQKDAPQIKSLYAEIAAGEFGAKASKDLEEFITKTKEEGAAARDMADAYAKGPLAVQQAFDAAKLAPYKKSLQDITELIARMKASGQTVPAGLVQSRDQQAALLQQATGAQQQTEKNEVAKAIGKEVSALAAETNAYKVLGEAALKSGEEQREAAAKAAALKFQGEHPGVDANPIYQAELAKQEAAYQQTIKQAAAESDLTLQYSHEMEKLEEIRAFLVSSDESTMSADAEMWNARIQYTQKYESRLLETQNQELLGNAKIYDTQQQLIEQWDQAALKVGNLSQQMGAFFSMVEQEGANLGEHVFGAFSKSLDDLSTQLADFVVTGKAKFGELVRSLEENLMKAAFQKTFSMVAGDLSAKLGLPTPQQQLGTATNPMFVKFADGTLTGGAPGADRYNGPLADGTGTGPLPFTSQDNANINLISSLDGPAQGTPSNPPSGLSRFFHSLLTIGNTPREGGQYQRSSSTAAPGAPPSSGSWMQSIGRQDGSQANPFYVIPTQLPGGNAPGAPPASAIGGSASALALGGSATSSSSSTSTGASTGGPVGSWIPASTSAPNGSPASPIYVVPSIGALAAPGAPGAPGIGDLFGGGDTIGSASALAQGSAIADQQSLARSMALAGGTTQSGAAQLAPFASLGPAIAPMVGGGNTAVGGLLGLLPLFAKIFTSTTQQNGPGGTPPFLSGPAFGLPGAGGGGGLLGSLGPAFGLPALLPGLPGAPGLAGGGLPFPPGLFGSGSMSSTASLFGGGSMGGGALGTSSNPMFVIMAPSAGIPGMPGAPGSNLVGGLFGGGSGGSTSTLFGGAPDGSQSSPFYVVESGGMGGGGGLGGLFGGGDSGGGGLMDLFGGGDSSGGGGFMDLVGGGRLFSDMGDIGDMGGMMGGLGGMMGGMGGGLSSLLDFLPMLAMETGGQVTPGNAYIVGEKRPEVFVPSTSGRIVPSIPEFSKSTEAQSGAGLSSSTSSALSDSQKYFVSSSMEKTAASFSNSAQSKAAASIVASLPRREYGGSVTAGNAYMTGEARPEVFQPDRAPSAASAGAAANRGGVTHVSSSFIVNGVTDADSFRKSQAQIMAEHRANLDRAFYRNNR